MGACVFVVRSHGKDPQDAFWRAVEKALYDFGHGGYSGSIGEKSSFVEIDLPQGEEVNAFVQRLIDEDDPRIRDKWGPAGCVRAAANAWLFFGWASS